MKIELRTPTRSDRSLIRRMLELYLYDFSEYDGSDLDNHASFGYGDLDYFWFEPTHAAFLITVDEKLAGFVLVDNEVMLAGSERSISEFFVMRKYRRHGVGKHSASEVFTRHESEGRLHCEVIAYFSPSASGLAEIFEAKPCQRPSRSGLGLLAGNEDSWPLLYPARSQIALF
ncbi:MAG: GNAT family N-acetyltransferase [Anaerolineales bacterium]|nr:MAG: GNAT family N-acetyltransferase [Anaerolineales bacterium]